MAFKNILILVITGAVCWLISDIASLSGMVFQYSYISRNPLQAFLLIAGLLGPVAVIVFAAALLNKNNAGIFEEDEEFTD